MFARVQIKYGFDRFQVRFGVVVSTAWIRSEYGFVILLDETASKSHTHTKKKQDSDSALGSKKPRYWEKTGPQVSWLHPLKFLCGPNADKARGKTTNRPHFAHALSGTKTLHAIYKTLAFAI